MAQRSKAQTRRQIQPESGPLKAFGQALREIRESKEISQERLALEGGFDRTYISLIERGINSPSIRIVVGDSCGSEGAAVKDRTPDGAVDAGPEAVGTG